MCLAGQPPPAPATAADAAAVASALAAAEISESWGRQICQWTELLPEDARGDADVILLGAAAGGAELGDLEGLAEEIRNRTARPDADDDDGFDDRGLRLARTFRGAGKLNGDLTPQCAAALASVLEALGKPGGPQDLRSKWQRPHGALEQACRPRPPAVLSPPAVARGCPPRAGRPRACAPGCGAAGPRRSAARWTPAPRPSPSPRTCAAWSSPGTGTAGSPAANSPRQHASRTTSCPGRRTAAPA